MIRLGERADLLADLEQRVTDRASLGELIEEACRLGDLDREAVQCPDEGADFPCDPELTALALAELLDNALHGSAVTVREDAGSLIVENQGGPLPRFAKDTLMVPFKGAKRQGGSSLGLPIALRAMELQDGEMTIEDRDDGGARAVLSWKA
jgi:signal transduction histidine kinase